MFLFFQKKWYNKNRNGYITLLSVLIIGAVGTSIATSLILLGLSSSRSSFAFEQSAQARALTEFCVEEALQQIGDFTPYAGTDIFNFEFGECTYAVSNTGGQNRTIQASSTVGLIIRKTEIFIDSINPQINITSWQEVEGF